MDGFTRCGNIADVMADNNPNNSPSTSSSAAKAIFDVIPRLQMTTRDVRKQADLITPLFPEIGKRLRQMADESEKLEGELTNAVIAALSK